MIIEIHTSNHYSWCLYKCKCNFHYTLNVFRSFAVWCLPNMKIMLRNIFERVIGFLRHCHCFEHSILKLCTNTKVKFSSRRRNANIQIVSTLIPNSFVINCVYVTLQLIPFSFYVILKILHIIFEVLLMTFVKSSVSRSPCSGSLLLFFNFKVVFIYSIICWLFWCAKVLLFLWDIFFFFHLCIFWRFVGL